MAATIKINMNTISNYYNNRKQILDQEIGETEKKINRITFLRLLLFSCALAFRWYGIKNSDSLFVATSAFLFIAFIIAVIKHIKLSNDKDLLKRREKVVANEIVLLEGKASMLNNGSAHEEASSYAHDLDVFGEQSLFHRISRCYSPGGRAKLATILTEPPIENQQIKDRQSAIEELAEKTEFRELLLALMLKNDEDKSPESALYQWSENYSPTGNIKLLYILRIALPLLANSLTASCNCGMVGNLLYRRNKLRVMGIRHLAFGSTGFNPTAPRGSCRIGWTKRSIEDLRTGMETYFGGEV